MDLDLYKRLKQQVLASPYAHDIEWVESVGECPNADAFFLEYAFVVCNSGMKEQIARKIFNRVMEARKGGKSASTVFGHKGKAAAIDLVFSRRQELFDQYKQASDKLAFLESLPWIGGITKYHLAKNFGVDCCKPDRHLVRIALNYSTTPEEMCRRVAAATGDRVATVDMVIWRAANLGFI